jgi:DNA-binding CsgD family transcriptional regulator
VEEIIASSNGDDSEIIHYLDLLSSLSTESFYVIDLAQRQICYISPNASFLGGYSVEEALRLGYDLYPQIVHPEDLPIVKKTHRAVLRNLSRIGENRDKIDYFFNVFRLKHHFSFLAKPLYQMSYHKAKPIWKDDGLAYFICAVGSAVARKAESLYLYFKNEMTYQAYNFTTQQWNTVTKEPLSEYEKAILILAGQGTSGHDIANELCVSYNGFRHHLSRLYAKLGVSNIREAILFATTRRMLFVSNTDKGDSDRPANEKASRRRLTAENLQRIQQELDIKLSIRKAAKKENVSEGAIRYWIERGKLKTAAKVRK